MALTIQITLKWSPVCARTSACLVSCVCVCVCVCLFVCVCVMHAACVALPLLRGLWISVCVSVFFVFVQCLGNFWQVHVSSSSVIVDARHRSFTADFAVSVVIACPHTQ